MQKARFLDKKRVVEELSILAIKAKARNKNIKKIILFGSLADDTYTALSDADLLIVIGKTKLRFVDRIPAMMHYFLEAPLPVDVFPYTHDEIERIPFARKAASLGMVLA